MEVFKVQRIRDTVKTADRPGLKCPHCKRLLSTIVIRKLNRNKKADCFCGKKLELRVK